MPLVTRGALGYVSYQKGIIQGHLVHRYASGRTPTSYSRIVFWTVLWLDVSTRLITCIRCPQNIPWGVISDVFDVHVAHWLLCQTDEIKTNFQPFHRLYIWGHRWILVLLFKYQCCGFQVHLKLIVVYNFKTKSDCRSKCPHYIIGYIINLGSMFFQFSLVLNLAYIDYSLCQIWSAYMQNWRCCDHSDKCLQLVTPAEGLLNLFGGVVEFI